MPTIHVELGEKSYPIIVDEGHLGQIGALIRPRVKSAKAIVIADASVSRHYGQIVLDSLSDGGFDSRMVEVPGGNESKSIEWFAKLHDHLIAHRMDRSSVLIALGGGVIGDLAGFVAATYMRGIAFVQAPTTLLAQVDASVGGKTAIDHRMGKNLIGAFHQPELVLIDVSTLQSLPPAEIRSGLVESIKKGVIMDATLFDRIEANLSAILDLEASILIEIIARSCENKARVVASDEKESGPRATLNYGHTFGHALEAITDYNTYRHGEAVAIGMNCAARLAVNLGMMPAADWERQSNLLQRANLPVNFPAEIAADQLIKTMFLDKKTQGGKLRLILPTQIGEVVIRDDVGEDAISEAITQCKSHK